MSLPHSELGVLAASEAIRVLIVEDDEDSAEALESILQHAKYDVRVARNAAEAEAMALTFQPNVALVDLGLPEVSGYEVAASLRALVGSCRLIASTAYCGGEYSKRSFAAGFEAHLTKPLDLPRLMMLLACDEAPLHVTSRATRRKRVGIARRNPGTSVA